MSQFQIRNSCQFFRDKLRTNEPKSESNASGGNRRYQYEYDADEDPSARLFPVGEPSRQQQQQQQQQQQSTGGLPVTWRFLDRWECGMAEYQGCNYDRGISGAFRCW